MAMVRYHDIVVWHYAFRDHWFKVNCTTDLEGLWGTQLRSCSSSVLVNETAEQVTAAHPA
jgi:hypothetical protein